ncbi:MAG TPA: Ig-like domain repeat protein, partial [Usitatibacter sp.]|nr:Ig-like domain repeat protein [Usitatibacter sp.]
MPSAAAVPDISNGAGHTCAITSAGEVYCWGSNTSGQLGAGSAVFTETPLPVHGLSSGVRAVASTRYMSCAATTAGPVFCWGRNLYGELGIGRAGTPEPAPVPVVGVSDVLALAAGDWHVCAIDAARDVYCWGREGSFGDTTATKVTGLPGPAASLAANDWYNCAATTSGEQWCWSGHGPASRASSPAPLAKVAMHSNHNEVTHACVLTTAGGVSCSGGNNYGELGWGGVPQTYVSGMGSGVADIANGYHHSCALTTGGQVRCWGSNSDGQLGEPLGVQLRDTPVTVGGLPSGVKSVWAGRNTSCAIAGADELWCWGAHPFLKPASSTNMPQRVLGPFDGVASIGFGGDQTCLVSTTAGAFCGGRNEFGQLGTGRLLKSPVPVRVEGLGEALAVSSGRHFSCALITNGDVLCWGAHVGEASISSVLPVRMPNIPPASAIDSGGEITCALTGIGVFCWRRSVPIVPPLLVREIPSIPVAVSAGDGGSGCALTGAGTVHCWGTDTFGPGTGELGMNAVQIPGIAGRAVSVSVGKYHGCVVAVEGSAPAEAGGDVYCWGSRWVLGRAPAADSRVAVKVSGFPEPVRRLESGDDYSCAVTMSERVYCWGKPSFGNLGSDVATEGGIQPLLVTALTGAEKVSAGAFNFEPFSVHTCALLKTMAVACWGGNGAGSLGNGTFAGSAQPVPVVSPGGAGTLEGDNWYLRLAPGAGNAVPPALVPRVLVVAQLVDSPTEVTLSATIRYRNADLGKRVGHYVIGLVPPAFFDSVKVAPGTPSRTSIKSMAKNGYVLAQLTKDGWTTVSGQFLAHSRAVANAGGNAAGILDRVPAIATRDSRFCIGYGEGPQSMLSGQTLRVVLESGTVGVSNVSCVLPGLYLAGPPTSASGTPATFEAALVGFSPTGRVQFYDGAAALESVDLQHPNEAVGTASFTSSSLAVGRHSIGATYSGDRQNGVISLADSVPVRHEVLSVPTGTTTALAGPASSRLGDAIVLSATVTGNAPTGLVQFRDGAANIGEAVPIDRGVATTEYVPGASGDRSFSAIYLGDARNAASTSGALAHRVADAIATQVVLASTPNPSVAGSPVNLTASVTGNSPTGNIIFRAGSRVLATAPLVSGTATAMLSTLEAGLFVVNADYEGDADDLPATSPAVHHEVRQPLSASSTTLVSSANPSSLAQAVAFTATVGGPSGAASGSMAFTAGGNTIPGCAAAVVSAGSASCATNSLLPGAHSIVATYSGDVAYAPSVSAALTQAVSSPVALASADPASIQFGGQSLQTSSATATVQLTNAATPGLTVTSVSAPPGFSLASDGCSGQALAVGASCQVGVAFRPTAEGPAGGLLAFTYAGGGPTVVSLTGTGERSLVTHYYRSILNRAPDAAGKAFWESEATRLSGLGVDINETWYVMAGYFFNSTEYLAANKSDTAFVTDLYNTFFNRAPDAGGLGFWVSQIQAGLPREVVLFSFMFSTEFRTFTQGIFGNTAA